jgi:hypothetical protein
MGADVAAQGKEKREADMKAKVAYSFISVYIGRWANYLYVAYAPI